MPLPIKLVYFHPNYEQLAIVPIGKKNKQVRTIGHKNERALLKRIQEAVEFSMMSKQPEERSILSEFISTGGKGVIVIPMDRQEKIYPHFFRPELFMWTTFSEQHGVPLHKDKMYDKNLYELSAEELEDHVHQVLQDYLFCALIARRTREEWLGKLERSFLIHPLLNLAREKKEVILAVETMNRSSLLSLLHPTEDVAYWRHRVEVVMRCYRLLPKDWLFGSPDMCGHEKELHFDSGKRCIAYHCPVCEYTFTYSLLEDKVTLQEEFPIPQAQKRINTIERQFNELVDRSPKVLEWIEDFAAARGKMKIFEETIVAIWDRQSEQQQTSLTTIEPIRHPVVSMYEQMIPVVMPEDRSGSPLRWMANAFIPDIQVLKKAKDWLPLLEETSLSELQAIRDDIATGTEPLADSDQTAYSVKGHAISHKTIYRFLTFLQGEQIQHPVHLLTQVMRGETTSKIREFTLEKSPVFGVLFDWQEKHILALFKQLEQDQLIQKQRKGYIVADRGRKIYMEAGRQADSREEIFLQE